MGVFSPLGRGNSSRVSFSRGGLFRKLPISRVYGGAISFPRRRFGGPRGMRRRGRRRRGGVPSGLAMSRSRGPRLIVWRGVFVGETAGHHFNFTTVVLCFQQRVAEVCLAGAPITCVVFGRLGICLLYTYDSTK